MMFQNCKQCNFADVEERGLNRTWYHLKWHHAISNLWWEPRFWLLVTRDFIFWWACRKDGGYSPGYAWRGFSGLQKDWQLAYEIRRHLEFQT